MVAILYGMSLSSGKDVVGGGVLSLAPLNFTVVSLSLPLPGASWYPGGGECVSLSAWHGMGHVIVR